MAPASNYPALKLVEFALAALQDGRTAEAEAHFHQVLLHEPEHVLALTRLAFLAYDEGRREEARGYLARAVAADPSNLQLLGFYGVMLHKIGRPREALDAFQRLLEHDPSNHDLWNAAGICCQETDQPARAMEFYLRAVTLRPDFAEAHNNLAVVLIREGQSAAAIEHLERAIALDPTCPDCFNNLGVALRNRFQYTRALAELRHAHALAPENADIVASLGELLSLLYEDGATVMLERAVALAPHDVEKHWNLALCRLRRGDYARGWSEYEVRWERLRERKKRRHFPSPLWLNRPGEDIRGKTILLYSEQGFGDTIQFLRYVPQVLALTPQRILLQVQEPLRRLVQEFAATLGPAVTVLGETAPVPPHDWHTPLMSLPLSCGTTSLDTVPLPLRLTPATPQRPSGSRPLRIGLAWSGNPQHERDRERSIPLEALLPLLQTPGCEWACLQVGPPAAELRRTGLPVEFPNLTDFAVTASIIDTLDLVIAADTAVAHLAASQGANTCILLPYIADWRWLEPTRPGPNSWYPTARIFRQRMLPPPESTQTELWRPVIAEVAAELERY